jgi:hypothetical protein
LCDFLLLLLLLLLLHMALLQTVILGSRFQQAPLHGV